MSQTIAPIATPPGQGGIAVVRISGTALEYLIASALASTNLAVFVDYAIPLVNSFGNLH